MALLKECKQDIAAVWMLLDAKTNILSFKDVCRDNEEYADIDPCDIR